MYCDQLKVPFTLAAIRQPAFLLAPDGTILDVNPAAEAFAARPLAGCSIEEVARILDLRRQDGTPLAPAELPAWKALTGEEVVELPLACTDSDGRTVHVLATASPIRVGGTVVGAFVLWQDVTGWRRALAGLEAAVDSVTDAVFISDAGGRFVRFNDAFATFHRFGSRDECPRTLDEYPEFLDVFLPDGTLASLDEWAVPRALRGETATNAEYILRRRDTGETWIGRYSFAPVRDTDGAVIGTVVVGRDITEQRQAELALEMYAEDLRRSNEDLERFTYVSSHDLQEPLRSIVSFSQLLERRYKGQLGQDADDFLDFIIEGGNRMQELILDLLAFSRVNTTRKELQPTDVTDVLAAVEGQLDILLHEAGGVIMRGPMPVVMADSVQLEQVFSNLVTNAIKFRRPDLPLCIRIGARQTDDLWEFSVADNGIGIEPEYFDRIFVIFQRLHTKDRYPGTGIGLAIVKRIIDRHGGRIWVESTPGKGSTFNFTLPAA